MIVQDETRPVNQQLLTDATLRWPVIARTLAETHASLVARKLHRVEAGVCLTCQAALAHLKEQEDRHGRS